MFKKFFGGSSNPPPNPNNPPKKEDDVYSFQSDATANELITGTIMANQNRIGTSNNMNANSNISMPIANNPLEQQPMMGVR
jgi:hypothetical protein